MPIDFKTPTEVMYGCLKQFGGIRNNELARILFSHSFVYGGVPLVDRLGERTFVSRIVSRAAPGDFPEGAFRPFSESAQKIYSILASKYPGLAGKQKIIEYFVGEGCQRMCDCLQELGLNDILYQNLVERLYAMDQIGVGDKAMLIILQFIATGTLGNPSRASKITQDYARRTTSTNFTTDIVHDSSPAPEVLHETDVCLGLCRIVDGRMRMPAYILNASEEGTEIGSLSTAENAINDVGPGVSRRHLRVFRDETGYWYAQGLGSTNGSVVIRADSNIEEPIELPRSERDPQEEAPCVQLFANDTLRLAGTTLFAVLEIA